MAGKEWSPYASEYDPIMCGSIDGTDVEPHDHALLRACNSKYKSDTSLTNDPEKTIYIFNIDQDSAEDAVRRAFSRFGPIRSMRLVRDLITGFSKGYAFIEYEDKYDAVMAAQSGHKTKVDDRRVNVEMELERALPGWKPRRLGGGFGGKKESGQLRFGCKERPFREPILIAESVKNLDHRMEHDKKSDVRDRQSMPSAYKSDDRGRDHDRNRDSYQRGYDRSDERRKGHKYKERRSRERDRAGKRKRNEEKDRR